MPGMKVFYFATCILHFLMRALYSENTPKPYHQVRASILFMYFETDYAQSYLEMALNGPLDDETRDNLSRSHAASKVYLAFAVNQ